MQMGNNIEDVSHQLEYIRQDQTQKWERVEDALQISQAEIIQAVRSEISVFRNAAAIEQAFQYAARSRKARGRRRSNEGRKGNNVSITCPNIKSRCHPSYRNNGQFTHNVEWSSNNYGFVIGTLQVEHVESIEVPVDPADTDDGFYHLRRSKNIRFTFKPPLWLSNLIVKIDIAMQIAQHDSLPCMTWSSLPGSRHIEPLIEDLQQLNTLSLDRRLNAIVAIKELEDVFEV